MTMKNVVKAVCLAALAGLVITATACNTTRGAGKDIEKGGEAIKKSAERNGAD